MAKRGALSGVEKFYIEGHTDLPVEDIAAALDRTPNAVKKYLESIGKEAQPKPTQTQQPAKKEETGIWKLMGRHERNGEKVATVMTKSASEHADATRPARLMTKKVQDAIHKPKS